MKSVFFSLLTVASVPAFATTLHDSPIICSSSTQPFQLINAEVVIDSNANGLPRFANLAFNSHAQVTEQGGEVTFEQTYRVFQFDDVSTLILRAADGSMTAAGAAGVDAGDYIGKLRRSRTRGYNNVTCQAFTGRQIVHAAFFQGSSRATEDTLKQSAAEVCPSGAVVPLTAVKYNEYDMPVTFSTRPTTTKFLGRPTMHFVDSTQYYECL